MGAERYIAYGVLLGLLGYNLYFHLAGAGAWPWLARIIGAVDKVLTASCG